METLKFLAILMVDFGVAIFLLLLIAGCIGHWLERKVVPNRYEWLAVLSHYEWKRTLQIKADMSKLKGKKVEGIVMYFDLDKLEEERLVEGRARRVKVQGYVLSSREYKLTSSGTRRKAMNEEGQDQETLGPLQHV